MANPRKFSEKIALHNQKQAEETAEFEKIMREVSDATNKQNLSCLDELKHSHQHHNVYRERPRSAVGPMRSRPAEKRIDTSPYSGSYLSPPLDTTWRRTHSDSSLHTSSHENNSHRRGVNECHAQISDDYDSMKRSFSCTPETRPRSALDMHRVPGISVYPSQQGPGAIQIPIGGSNTGSLPDLSSFHIPSPLDVPLDSEEMHCINNTHCGSPRSLSPTHLIRNNRFTFIGSSPNEAPGPPHSVNHVDRSPRHSQSRPNPQMSPQLAVYKYGSTSPSSSPQSPPSPSSSVCKMNPLEQNNFYISQEQVTLQHHFEQFSMSEESCTKLRSHELTPDLGYYSTSPHQYSRVPPETSSNTPSSIPDIILTDFSNGEDLGKDFGVNMVDNLAADLFPTDECLREGLDPIDIDGLQMLTDPDPNMIADPATEDHLRLDRL